jgi:hypothetical protein
MTTFTILSPTEKRCQGRQARSMGTATLCSDCCDCLRRTDLPQGVDLQWMEPPKLVYGFYGPFCPQRLVAEVVEV